MENKTKEKEVSRLNSIAKFSALGFQMIATIGVITFIGFKIDENRGGNNYVFTAIFGLISVLISLCQVIKQVTKLK